MRIRYLAEINSKSGYTVGENKVKKIAFNEAMTGDLTMPYGFSTYSVYFTDGDIAVIPANLCFALYGKDEEDVE